MAKILSKLVLVVLLMGAFQANAQMYPYRRGGYQQGNPNRQKAKEDTDFVSHLRWGFGFGLSISNGGSLIEFDPQIGYQFDKYWLAGIGFSYSYLSAPIFDPNTLAYVGNYSTSNYGGRVFAECHFLPMLFAHFEYEAMNFDYQYINSNPNSPLYGAAIDAGRTWVGNPLLGLGYQMPIGPRSYAYIMLLYDLNFNNAESAELYDYSPIVYRAGLMFHF